MPETFVPGSFITLEGRVYFPGHTQVGANGGAKDQVPYTDDDTEVEDLGEEDESPEEGWMGAINDAKSVQAALILIALSRCPPPSVPQPPLGTGNPGSTSPEGTTGLGVARVLSVMSRGINVPIEAGTTGSAQIPGTAATRRATQEWRRHIIAGTTAMPPAPAPAPAPAPHADRNSAQDLCRLAKTNAIRASMSLPALTMPEPGRVNMGESEDTRVLRRRAFYATAASPPPPPPTRPPSVGRLEKVPAEDGMSSSETMGSSVAPPPKRRKREPSGTMPQRRSVRQGNKIPEGAKEGDALGAG